MHYHIMTFRDLKTDRRIGDLYYFDGNFFSPLDIPNHQLGISRRLCREFYKTHKAMVDADRKKSTYKTPMQLADLKPGDYPYE